MDDLHAFIASAPRPRRPQAPIAIMCAYASTPGPHDDDASWAQAIELARAGFEVWVVVPSIQRARVERAVEAPDAAGVNVLFWDAPAVLGVLRRWSRGARLHAALWHWIVERAIAQWHAAVGMRVVRRVVQPAAASITYVLMPTLVRAERTRFGLRPLRD